MCSVKLRHREMETLFARIERLEAHLDAQNKHSALEESIARLESELAQIYEKKRIKRADVSLVSQYASLKMENLIPLSTQLAYIDSMRPELDRAEQHVAQLAPLLQKGDETLSGEWMDAAGQHVPAVETLLSNQVGLVKMVDALSAVADHSAVKAHSRGGAGTGTDG